MYPLYTVVYDTYTLQYVYITSSSQNALYKPANAPLPVIGTSGSGFTAVIFGIHADLHCPQLAQRNKGLKLHVVR